MGAAGAIRAGAAYVEVFLERNALSRSLAATSASCGVGRPDWAGWGPLPAAASCLDPWQPLPTSRFRPLGWSPACWPPCVSGPQVAPSLPTWPRRPGLTVETIFSFKLRRPAMRRGHRRSGHGHPPDAGRYRRGGPGYASGQQGPSLDRRQR